MIETKSENRNLERASRAACSREGRAFTTEGLFAGETEVNISHNGEVYRLRITSNDKLILTK